MVGKRSLVNAIASTLESIPEVMVLLAEADPIDAYVDDNPTRNQVDAAIYQMQAGQLLILWRETRLQREGMGKWLHLVEICTKPLPDQSNMDLMDAVVNGVPNPGDGMYWRNCPVMAGLLPTEVIEMTFRTNTEGVDYGSILTETLETGDYPKP